MYPHHVFDLEPAGTFGMYPICYQRVSGRYFQPEPAMYSRCFCWFPGPLAPSDLIGHGTPCQLTFNLAFMDGVGMTHGESVETIWSHSMSLATWSRENGPAARHLILDDHWAGWNWSKLVGLRKNFPFTINVHLLIYLQVPS